MHQAPVQETPLTEEACSSSIASSSHHTDIHLSTSSVLVPSTGAVIVWEQVEEYEEWGSCPGFRGMLMEKGFVGGSLWHCLLEGLE